MGKIADRLGAARARQDFRIDVFEQRSLAQSPSS